MRSMYFLRRLLAKAFNVQWIPRRLSPEMVGAEIRWVGRVGGCLVLDNLFLHKLATSEARASVDFINNYCLCPC